MTTDDDFAVAKAVADLLKGVASDRQVRVLRWVSESLGIVAPHARPIDTVGAHGESAMAQSQPNPVAAADIKSFVLQKAPKSDNQFAATVAYYYRFEAPQNDRLESIGAEVLREATRLAGRTRLGDPGKTLRNAKDMGYLDAADRGEFKINSVGENLVAMTLPGEGRVSSAKAVRRKGSGKKSKR